MTYRAVASVNAVVSFAFGLITLVAPDVLASVYGVSADTTTLVVARLLGGSYLGYAIVDLLTRDSRDPVTRRAVAGANAFAWGAGFVVAGYGQVQGFANGFGWLTVAMQIIFTVAWVRVYVVEREPRGSQAATIRP